MDPCTSHADNKNHNRGGKIGKDGKFIDRSIIGNNKLMLDGMKVK